MHLYDRVPFPVLEAGEAQCFMDPCASLCNEKNFKLIRVVNTKEIARYVYT